MVRPRSAYYKQWREKNRSHVQAYKRENRPDSDILTVDGEGLTRDGHHTYNYLAVCHRGEVVSSAENLGSLSTRECLDALCEAKLAYPHSTMVGFSLGYDYTMMLRDVPSPKLFRLYHPELRRNAKGHMVPVRWGGFLLNLLRNRLTVTKLLEGHRKGCKYDDCEGCVKGPTATIWDLFGFYQSSFIDSCLKWQVVDEPEYKYLKSMKDARPTFQEEDWKGIKAYCHVECDRLGELFERLRQAHKDADLPLRSYFGAGSTATVLLKRMGVKECMPKTLPIEVEAAAQAAFFGGRFEHSRVGPYTGDIYSYDIASAYPYQAYRLPCLACGKWKHVTRNVHKAIEASRFALIRYTLRDSKRRDNDTSSQHWGPFPFRTNGVAGVGPNDSILDDGSIIYPTASGGGWTYRDEYLIAAEHWQVTAKEAWIYETQCSHHPFKGLADAYIERLRLGKEGAGIVLKLGINSCYGKVAQTVGNPLYRCLLWAGAITSGCRAQLLSLLVQDPSAVLGIATDGLLATRPLDMLKPEDTGTHERAKAFGKVGLGAWEEKVIPDGGLMLIRPGIAFAFKGKLDTKGRGIGKSTLERHKEMILESWKEYGPKPVALDHVIFRGAKSSISVSESKGFNRSPEYGQWVKRKTVISYDPEPKRPYHTESDGRLSTWALSQKHVSAPYDRSIESGEARAATLKKLIASEQPDTFDTDNLL